MRINIIGRLQSSDVRSWTCNAQAAEKALRAAHFAHDRNRMPSYQTSELSQLTTGLADADILTTVTHLISLLKDADYLRYPSRHATPAVPHDVIDAATRTSAIHLTTRLLQQCQQFIDRHWPTSVYCWHLFKNTCISSSVRQTLFYLREFCILTNRSRNTWHLRYIYFCCIIFRFANVILQNLCYMVLHSLAKSPILTLMYFFLSSLFIFLAPCGRLSWFKC